ncbi:MAG: hypothetical protein ACLP81_07350 [Acidimicrobiales bacterium]
MAEPDPKVLFGVGNDVCAEPELAATAEVDNLAVDDFEASFRAEMSFWAQAQGVMARLDTEVYGLAVSD